MPKPRTKQPCLHCGRGVRWRTRGLCKRCYTNLEIRAKHAPLCEKRSRRHDPTLLVCPAAIPTQELPGTDGKIREMAERAEKKVDIFHPLDARWEGKPKVAQTPRVLDVFGGEEVIADEVLIRDWIDNILEEEYRRKEQKKEDKYLQRLADGYYDIEEE